MRAFMPEIPGTTPALRRLAYTAAPCSGKGRERERMRWIKWIALAVLLLALSLTAGWLAGVWYDNWQTLQEDCRRMEAELEASRGRDQPPAGADFPAGAGGGRKRNRKRDRRRNDGSGRDTRRHGAGRGAGSEKYGRVFFRSMRYRMRFLPGFTGSPTRRTVRFPGRNCGT